MFARRIPLISVLLAFIIIRISPQNVKADTIRLAYSGGICVVLAVDDSTSMLQTDPGFLRYRGARLFAGLLDADDQAALVQFNGQVAVAGNGWVSLGGAHALDNFISLIRPTQPSGYTDLAAALEASANLLKDRVCSRKAILLLTDGRPELNGGLPSDYVDKAEDLAGRLGFPVWGIALTGEAESDFLYRIAQASGGRIVPAHDASDLVDAYLAVLAGIKDRTILSGESQGHTGPVGVKLDAGLAPYVQRITLVAVGQSGLVTQPIGPGYTTFEKDDAHFSFELSEDDFSVYAVDHPAPGSWGFDTIDPDKAQVRAILRSSLRVREEIDSEYIPLGEPLAVKARLIEEAPDGQALTVIGDVAFSAEIESPDGSRASLDRLYDDGTHADEAAGDGIFTAIFGTVTAPGDYRLRLTGYKGSIQAETAFTLHAVQFPRLILDSPVARQVDVREDPISIESHFDLTGNDAFAYAQVSGQVIGPDGHAYPLEMTWQGDRFSGAFLPVEEGLHHIEVWADSARFKDRKFKPVAVVDIDIRLVPVIQLDEKGLDLGEAEVDRLRTGIRYELALSVSSRQVEPLQAVLAGFPGTLELRGEPSLFTPGENRLYLTFRGNLAPGGYSGELILTGRSGVEITHSRIPVRLTVIQPVVLANPDQIDFGKLTPGKEPASLSLSLHSTSSKSEVVELAIEGATLSLSDTSITLPPGGDALVRLEVDPSRMAAAEYSGKIHLRGRPGLELLPVEIGYHYMVLPFPIWKQALPFLEIMGGAGLLLSISLAAVRSSHPHPWGRLKPVKGPAGAALPGVIDLSRARVSLLDRSVVIGRAASAGVRIEGGTVSPAHAAIRVQRVEMMEKVGRPPRLSPVRRVVHTVENLGDGRVLVDLRPVPRGAASAPLKNGSKLTLGDFEFTFQE